MHRTARACLRSRKQYLNETFCATSLPPACVVRFPSSQQPEAPNLSLYCHRLAAPPSLGKLCCIYCTIEIEPIPGRMAEVCYHLDLEVYKHSGRGLRQKMTSVHYVTLSCVVHSHAPGVG